MKWYGALALVFLLFLLAGIVYAGANTDKIGFVIIPVAFATHDPDFNHPTPEPDKYGGPVTDDFIGSDRHPENRLILLTITLDQEIYKTGEIIKFSGNTGIKNSDSLATVTLLKPDKTVVTSIQMMPNENGTVSYQFKAGSGNMDVSGNYAFKITHEYANISDHDNQTEYYTQSVLKIFSFNVVEDAPYFGIFVYMDNLFSWIIGK